MHIERTRQKRGESNFDGNPSRFCFYDFDGNNGGRNVAYIEILSLVWATATF